jgi:hypothetical protein
MPYASYCHPLERIKKIQMGYYYESKNFVLYYVANMFIV